MRDVLLLSSLLLLLTNCQKDPMISTVDEAINQETDVQFADVDERLWVYFERFEAEAKLRGIEVDLNQDEIIGVIEVISEDQVAGRCNYHSQLPNRVTIDDQFWRNSNDLYREAVVFHELGHCQLIRDHREAQDNAGRCRSLMASGTENCQLAYSPQTRAAYLDELFDPRFAGDWFN